MQKNKYYFTYSEELEKELWQDSIIIFDTSALIELYFYTEITLKQIKKNIFDNLLSRLWITSHIEYEFYKHKDKKRLSPILSYNDLIKFRVENKDSGYLVSARNSLSEFEKHIEQLKQKIKKETKHPHIKTVDIDLFLESFKNGFKNEFSKFETDLQEQINKVVAQLESNSEDFVNQIIDENFQIGEEYDFRKKTLIAREGSFRYENKVPPGYEDSKKEGLSKYSDLIIWKQILDLSKKSHKNIIFVTKDTKIDWCHRLNNKPDKIEKPRDELILEFISYTNQKFWMYSITDFFQIAGKYCAPVTKNALQEINRISMRSESFTEEMIEKWLLQQYPKHDLYFEYFIKNELLNNYSVDFLLDDKKTKIGVEIRGLKISKQYLSHLIERCNLILESKFIDKYILVLLIESIDDFHYYSDIVPLVSSNLEIIIGIIDKEKQKFYTIN